MKDNKEIEKILLDDKEYEKLVESKIKKEFSSVGVNSDKAKKIITDIKNVPKDKLFSKSAVYLVLNKDSDSKSCINGIQAEGFLGSQNSAREKFLSGETDYFISGNSYIRFLKFKA